jgi:hypothetical protein
MMAQAKTLERSGAVRDGAGKPPLVSVVVNAGDIARRAYDLYCARGCEHGHDVEDWLQAERELNESAHSTLA